MAEPARFLAEVAGRAQAVEAGLFAPIRSAGSSRKRADPSSPAIVEDLKEGGAFSCKLLWTSIEPIRAFPFDGSTIL